jgi:acetolactate synthase I/II/III large subunit
MATLAQLLLAGLRARGITQVFGIPGVHNLELYRALPESGLRHLGGRHEQALGFMADGYARISGRPAACLTITGPGLTNILTAMAQAYAESVPMLVIASQNRLGEIGTGRGFLHELPDQAALAALVSAASFSLTDALQLPAVLDAAFDACCAGRPRPVYIEVPRDALAATAAGIDPRRSSVPSLPPPADAAALGRAAALLRSARRPLLVAGGGARGAGIEIRRLAEHIQAPVVMTTNGRGLLPADHPLGISYSPSLAPVRELIGAADVVLAAGTELGPTDFDMYSTGALPPPAGLIRIDIDARQLTRNATPAVPLLGDCRQALAALLAQDLGPGRAAGAACNLVAVRAASTAALSTAMRRQIGLLEMIRDALPEAVMVGDSTQPVYAGNLGYAAAAAGSWFNSATGYGTLGYGLPAAIGASVAAPDRPVVALVGDGGLQFCLGEFGTLRDLAPWVAVLVWNNGGYGEINVSMQQAGILPLGVDIRPPQLEQLAHAYELAYRRVASTAELERGLHEFRRARRPLIVDIDARPFE